MSTQIRFHQKDHASIDAYHLLEIQEIFERTRSYSNLRVQIATFFGTINLTTLGLAFSLQKAGLFLVAAATLGLWMISDAYAKRELRSFYFRGLELEKKYAPDGERALLHTYLGVAKSRRDLTTWLTGVALLESQTERVTKLRALKPSFGGMWWALILAMLIELGIGIGLSVLGGWPLG